MGRFKDIFFLSKSPKEHSLKEEKKHPHADRQNA